MFCWIISMILPAAGNVQIENTELTEGLTLYGLGSLT